MKLLLLAIFSMVSFCVSAQVSREVDDFTDEIIIRSPHGQPLHLTKVISESKTQYYFSLYAIGETLNTGINGVIVLFDDGTKWKKNTKIDVSYNEYKEGWEYFAFIPITQSEVDILCRKKIEKFRLYIYDKTINAWESSMFAKYCREIKEMK